MRELYNLFTSKKNFRVDYYRFAHIATIELKKKDFISEKNWRTGKKWSKKKENINIPETHKKE
jgi:hypothetical protein